MNRETALKKLQEILKPYSQNQDALANISGTTHFVNDLQVNSANLVDVFLDAEEVFGIDIDNASLEKIENVSDVINVILLKLEQKNNSAE